MSSWEDLPYGWAVIALGVGLLAISGMLVTIPVEHGREVRYATPVDRQSGAPPGTSNVSDLSPECRTIVRRLGAGENVSREYYAIRFGETTYVVHNTNYSDRPIASSRWQIQEENYTGWTPGGRLADWQLQEDYCTDHIDRFYRIEGDLYLVKGRGRYTSLWPFYRNPATFVFVGGILLIVVGQNLRRKPISR